ncbi:MarR family transcriptional regulator [Mycobacterium sp.]|uniref:MarR family winged helix-turn-helix transcriptional regulator n=1 Tax=Mycobacterium sp. TaxID=1785 RepID=UPI0031DDFE2B
MARQTVGKNRTSPVGSGKSSSGDAAQDDSVDAIADALLTASRLLVDISRRSIARVDGTLTIPQFRVLLILSSQDTVNLATLAGLLEVKPSAAGRMVDRLVGAELIDRCPHPTSRRELLVALTPRGRKVVREVLVRRRKEIAEIVENMPTPDRRGLTRGLKAFTTAGGEPAVLLDDEP